MLWVSVMSVHIVVMRSGLSVFIQCQLQYRPGGEFDLCFPWTNMREPCGIPSRLEEFEQLHRRWCRQHSPDMAVADQTVPPRELRLWRGSHFRGLGSDSLALCGRFCVSTMCMLELCVGTVCMLEFCVCTVCMLEFCASTVCMLEFCVGIVCMLHLSNLSWLGTDCTALSGVYCVCITQRE